MFLYTPTWTLLVPGALVRLPGMTLPFLPAFRETSIDRRVLSIHTMIMGIMINRIRIGALCLINSTQLWSAKYPFSLLAPPRKVEPFGDDGSGR